MMQWIEADWPAPANVHALSTLRTGGVSQGCYQSLNLAQHVGDDPERVRQNRQILTQTLSLPDEPVWLQQVHGVEVVKLHAKTQQAPPVIADASCTEQAGIVCAVLTADCLPIVLCSDDSHCIAAIHAGWRGLLNGVIENTLQALPKARYIAWLGPAIGPDCFEVGHEVRQAFVQQQANAAAAFKPHNTNKWLADIAGLARLRLNALGVEQIFGGNRCTMTEKDCFFSYRRDGQTGRMATLIWRD